MFMIKRYICGHDGSGEHIFMKGGKHKNAHEPCNLECVEDSDAQVNEFAGPVKLVIVDPPEDQNEHRASAAAFIAVAFMMIGVNTAIIILFTLSFRLPMFINAHIILCTIGYQFCMPAAILMMHSLHGPAAPLKESERRNEHIGLHVLGMAFAILGSFLAIERGEPSSLQPEIDKMTTYHFYAGCATAAVSLLSIVIGLILVLVQCFCEKMELGTRILIYLHRYSGMLAFLLSSVCFILGIIKPSIQVWVFLMGYASPAYVILFFTIFYTSVVIVIPGSRFTSTTY